MNRIPSSVLHWKTPFEIMYNTKPDYSFLRTFGCLCYITNTKPHKGKFETRGYKCVFIGYNPGQKAYKVYNLSNKQVQVSRDITFYENCFPFKSEINPITDKPSPVIPYPECHDDDSITIPFVSSCNDKHIEPFQNINIDSSSGETTADSSSTDHNSIPLVHVPFLESPENMMSETQALRQSNRQRAKPV
ncbi:Uncharacterized protein Adt_34284 [Abeliophyllum distichum]|uniref:Retroviral polymerase SH3-like domain-containing protein n=1 Tax=Abeliophyllum distichum TaxID=126358 RepID=A0ABD1QYS4_9LAMI